ncbi:Transmembrane protein [Trema orientale]|uniref:Transmembrane protein n=1 Tax=Trema orientale TaxID=63057 RepID=A0A2P5FPE8_TREOI|nr:Transmembrane protein [Trema orientale]
MSNYSFGSASPKSFSAYPRGDFDLESGTIKRVRKHKTSPLHPLRMIKSIRNRLHYYFKLHPLLCFLISLSLGVSIFLVLSLYESRYKMMNNYQSFRTDSDKYPFPNLQNLVMVAGHSVYTSSSCGKFDEEDSWFLEPYQKNPGQAATFLAHIQGGIELAAKDDAALLLFSGGETRKGAGPMSEAQSYWAVAESKGWFGKGGDVKSRAVTEEHARDSFENLLFSVCRFRELTGAYPQNITVSPVYSTHSRLSFPVYAAGCASLFSVFDLMEVVSYDFKAERFAQLHRSALGFPESRFFFSGTPATSSSRAAAEKGEALVRTQFKEDPYGCRGSLLRKKLGRDPFHRTIPYPNGCPEIDGLFRYCGTDPYRGSLPWA